MENYANDAGREFGWDDEIQNDRQYKVRRLENRLK